MRAPLVRSVPALQSFQCKDSDFESFRFTQRLEIRCDPNPKRIAVTVLHGAFESCESRVPQGRLLVAFGLTRQLRECASPVQ